MNGYKKLALICAIALSLTIPAQAVAQAPTESGYSDPDLIVLGDPPDPCDPASSGDPATSGDPADACSPGEPSLTTVAAPAAPADTTVAESGSTLPLTGFDAFGLVAVGVALVAFGVGMRTLTRRSGGDLA